MKYLKKNDRIKNKFRVFVRNWWRENPNWPDGLEPDTNARKTYISKLIENEDDAVKICKEYNATHNAGRLSRKAEFELY